MSMGPCFATWLLTVCPTVICLVADAAVPSEPNEDNKVMIQATFTEAMIQQRSTHKGLRLGDRDPATCTEAVLVEPRAVHYTSVALSSAVGVPGIDLITLAHSKDNAEFAEQVVKGSAKLENAYNEGSLQLLQLPVGDLGGDSEVNDMPAGLVVVNSNSTYKSHSSSNSGSCAGYHHEYTRLLMSPGFWKLLHCDRVLVFQSDTVFCRGSSVALEEFAEFPYIGGETPLMSGGGRIHMNGGFSLRSRAAMLQCIEDAVQNNLINGGLGEDQIYSLCPHLKQPPKELADRFAIDNALKMPSTAPLGVHKPWAGEFGPQVTEMCDGAQALTDAVRAAGCLLTA